MILHVLLWINGYRTNLLQLYDNYFCLYGGNSIISLSLILLYLEFIRSMVFYSIFLSASYFLTTFTIFVFMDGLGAILDFYVFIRLLKVVNDIDYLLVSTEFLLYFVFVSFYSLISPKNSFALFVDY